MFGGNSNWRGPVWFPVNLLIVRALLLHYMYYGDEFTVECPTGSGHQMTLFEVAIELSNRLVGTFLRDEHGRRPVYGGTTVFQNDPHWRDLVLFYEYYHGDNGAGLGASHQTGWSGVVARLIQMLGHIDSDHLLADGGRPLSRPFRLVTGEPVADATTARAARGSGLMICSPMTRSMPRTLHGARECGGLGTDGSHEVDYIDHWLQSPKRQAQPAEGQPTRSRPPYRASA